MSVKSAIRLVVVNLIILLALAAVGLAAAEAYLRLTIPPSSGGSLFESTIETRRFKVMKANARIVAYGSEFRTNSNGFRAGHDFQPKTPGAYRIVVLGDSFTASAGVDEDDIFTSLVQEELRRISPDVEVLNLAVGGYNPIQEELVLQEVGFALQPDLVIAAIFPFNDLSNEDYRANQRDALGQPATAPRRPLYSDLHVYRAFLRRIESRLKVLLHGPPEGISAEMEMARARTMQDADENLAALEGVVRSSTEAGIRAVVVLLPNTDAFAEQRAHFAPFVSNCVALHWDCLDLLGAYSSSGATPSSLRLNALDPHPNSRYHEIAAAAIAAHLAPIVLSHDRGLHQGMTP